MVRVWGVQRWTDRYPSSLFFFTEITIFNLFRSGMLMAARWLEGGTRRYLRATVNVVISVTNSTSSLCLCTDTRLCQFRCASRHIVSAFSGLSARPGRFVREWYLYFFYCTYSDMEMWAGKPRGLPVNRNVAHDGHHRGRYYWWPIARFQRHVTTPVQPQCRLSWPLRRRTSVR